METMELYKDSYILFIINFYYKYIIFFLSIIYLYDNFNIIIVLYLLYKIYSFIKYKSNTFIEFIISTIFIIYICIEMIYYNEGNYINYVIIYSYSISFLVIVYSIMYKEFTSDFGYNDNNDDCIEFIADICSENV